VALFVEVVLEEARHRVDGLVADTQSGACVVGLANFLATAAASVTRGASAITSTPRKWR
jgi:hypothetical protein